MLEQIQACLLTEQHRLSTGLSGDAGLQGGLWHGARMTGDAELRALFDDLETQAHGQALAARDVDVADLARAEYAEVTLEDRLAGSVGEGVVIHLDGGVTVRGTLERVGRRCAVVRGEAGPAHTVLVNLDHLLSAATPSARARAEQSRPLTSRLGLASAMRHLSLEHDRLATRLADGRTVRGEVVRVGADFLELRPAPDEAGTDNLVPLAAAVTVEPW